MRALSPEVILAEAISPLIRFS